MDPSMHTPPIPGETNSRIHRQGEEGGATYAGWAVRPSTNRIRVISVYDNQ